MANENYMANQYGLVKDFIATAKQSKHCIYNPGTKTWFTPEEFGDAVNNQKLKLKDGWTDDYKIMNPQKGLAAAEILAQQLNAKKLAFQQKVIDYYRQT